MGQDFQKNFGDRAAYTFLRWVLLFSFIAFPSMAQGLTQIVARHFESGSPVTVIAPAGNPPVGTVLRDGEPIARFGSSHAILGTLGYSGRPIDVLVTLGNDGRIIGADLLAQEEPILTIGISSEALHAYVAAFAGADISRPVRELKRDGSVPDGVSGATVSSGVIRDAILRTGRVLLEARASPVRASQAQEAAPSWADLVAEGAISVLSVSFADARAAMPGAATLPDGDGTFSEIAAAVLGDRAQAARLLGADRYSRLEPHVGADDLLVLVAARGIYSAKGTAWKKTGMLERLELVSGGRVVTPLAQNQIAVERLAADDAPQFREIMLLAIPPSSGIARGDPLALNLVVNKIGDGAAAPVRFSLPLDGEVAAEIPAGDAGEPLWQENWHEATPQLVILAVMLTVLFGVLYVSGPIVRRPRLYFWFRMAFLSVTLVWLGWIAGAQLSVVQLVAFINSLIGGFNWDVFLLAPLIFVLWAFIALGILFWGRGVYCGWLCPFGALQELVHKTGAWLGIKRIEVPWEIHERLWPVKYVALLAIIGLSLRDSASAFRAAEIEPFKTAITLHFLRDWPFVAYAGALLAASLFVERAYCRYLCPLGAALAIPSKFKIFDWLIRRPQCGRECRVCAVTCTVQAIDPIGRINPDECIYCLKCQVNYHDPETCVPLKMRARRRAGGAAQEHLPELGNQ